jgi:PKD repeat protein
MKRISFLFFLLISFTMSKAQHYILGYEYWCDTIQSSHVFVPIAPQQQFLLDTSLSFPGVEKGLHSFHIRFQQSNGFWSQTSSGYFFKTGEAANTPGLIDAYRYWVEGEDTVVTVYLSTPVSPYNLTTSLDLSWVDKGPNYLYIQLRDEQQNWSIPAVDSFYKHSIPVANFYTDDTLVCSNDSVSFMNTSNDADLFLWDFGDGDSSNDENPVHYYQQPGYYTVTLTATDTTLGIDSTWVIDSVHVRPSAHASFSFNQSGLQVTFNNLSSNALSYHWDFGDSAVSMLENPVHTYQHDGNYTVILTVMDSCGISTDTQFVSMILFSEHTLTTDQISISRNSGQIRIHFLTGADNSVYSLIDPTGQILLTARLEHILPGQIETFSIAGLAQGIYYLRIVEDDKMLTRPLIVLSQQ